MADRRPDDEVLEPRHEGDEQEALSGEMSHEFEQPSPPVGLIPRLLSTPVGTALLIIICSLFFYLIDKAIGASVSLTMLVVACVIALPAVWYFKRRAR